MNKLKLIFLLLTVTTYAEELPPGYGIKLPKDFGPLIQVQSGIGDDGKTTNPPCDYYFTYLKCMARFCVNSDGTFHNYTCKKGYEND